MKVISAIVNPIPDEDGYHIFECDNCNNYFLVNMHHADNNHNLYCPYCGNSGSMFTFTNNIRKKVFKDHPVLQGLENTDVNNITDVNIDTLQEILQNVDTSQIDVDVVEYTVGDIISKTAFTEYEFICCEKAIKIPTDIYHTVCYCTFCKGEILLNIKE